MSDLSGPGRVARSEEAAFAGFGSFCKVPVGVEPEALAQADCAIFGAPVDSAVTNRPGARFGPKAIREVQSGSHFPPSRPHIGKGTDPFQCLSVIDYGDAEVKPADPEGNIARIESGLDQIRAAQAMPVLLGGDHSVLYPSIRSVSKQLGPDGFLLVQLDSHPDTTPAEDGRLTHGSPVRLLVEQGLVEPGNIAQFGLRGYWPPPEVLRWADDVGIRRTLMAEIVEHGFRAEAESLLDWVAAKGLPVYLSLDIDVLDPAFAPGTGTPEYGGITSRELLWLLGRASGRFPLVGMDVVEVSPPFDPTGVTAGVAHYAILEVLTGLAEQRIAEDPL